MASPVPDPAEDGHTAIRLQRRSLAARFHAVRGRSEEICRPLEPEDYVIQSMADVSPPKWHLAHTSWFFEAFVLHDFRGDYRVFHPRYAYLFNSYYQTVGSMHPRSRRGLLSRPTVEEVYRYRAHVNEAVAALIEDVDDRHWPEVAFRLTLGLHHEQQHQELLLTDIKHIFAGNPLRPAYLRADAPEADRPAPPLRWIDLSGGLKTIGHGGEGFAYDNETPRHRVHLEDFRLASRPVTNGEYLEFMGAGGYGTPELWLSDGWAAVRSHRWEAPLYWERMDGRWWHMTLSGLQPVEPSAPVCHVSLYEADAYARWKGARLPTEAEWETAASTVPIKGNFYEQGRLQPRAGEDGTAPAQMFGDTWEWTQSSYAPYPGFKPLAGSLGEYNGKFMCNQVVLRGGSCVTAASHIRPTYRNFFYPPDRWQFTGIRLAQTP